MMATRDDRSDFLANMGPVIQLGFVERDLESALAAWKAMGVGPFFVADHVQFSRVSYRDRPAAIDMTAAFSYWGDMQIELIYQHDAGPSVYRSWIDGDLQGVHHFCVQVEDMNETRRRCAAAGVEIEQDMLSGNVGEFIYVRLPCSPTRVVEFAQIDPSFDRVFQRLQSECLTWDGRRPVRQIDELMG